MAVAIVAQPVRVIARPAACKVIVAVAPVRIVSGGRGPAGPVGEGGGATDIDTVAVGAVGGQRVVKSVDGGVTYAGSDAPEDAPLIVGVSIGAAADAAAIKVRTAGPLQDPAFSWELGPIYLGLAGVLTQTPPVSGLLCQVGTAIAADTMIVDLRPPIVLA